MTLKCVLWDFGDTLVDEKFMRQSPPTVPQWGAVWAEIVSGRTAMCLAALKRLGGDIEPSESLLIDNKAHNIDAWAAQGGPGYLYRGEEAFRDDLAGELCDLADSVLRGSTR